MNETMPKLRPPILALAAALLVPAGITASPAAAAVAGDKACSIGKPSVRVRVSGFKQPTGTLKVVVYGDENFLKKGGTLRKVKVPVHSRGPLDVCLSVPGPGRYAVAVHHDLNGNRDKDRADGGGFSGNPQLSIVNLRPRFNSASFEVGGTAKVVPVRLQYLQGLRIAPIQS